MNAATARPLAARSAASVRKDVLLSACSILLLVVLLFPLYWICLLYTSPSPRD